ncbi:Succinyl-CoA--D-citramalate CoA-transferase [Geodia barretti]|uniref:Succinyl-CoA--D-citramalate CoA-transferase n=1 Tax=Geodia barretti TaxID=519541 RepID=A0AA35R1M3_GEOBA|nr:Succinyl-CoA--D-citramalate CoA-transferase [Geodia barretti]
MQPLSGIRVLSVTVYLAGPFASMSLARLGAEVIKVEIPGRGDPGTHPRRNSDEDISTRFLKRTQGVKSVTLDLKTERGRELFLELAKQSDVVLENLAPGSLRRAGLGYEEVAAVNPGIVYASISGYGQTGPYKDKPAHDPQIQGMSGLMDINGEADGPRSRLKHAFADLCGALHAVYAITSALHQRRRTGLGQYIDISMLRATVATMGAGLMEYELTGRVPHPRGNYDPVMAPYGNYPCLGEDEWVSIAVRTEEEWRGLVKAIDNPDWAVEENFASRYARLGNRGELDERLSEWTRGRSAWEATELLQSCGVAAFPVLGAEGRLFNPHFRERGLYSDIEHPALGSEPVFNLMWQLSRTPPSIQRHAPLLGEHNRDVFCGLLGLDEAELSRLEEEQVIW